MLEKTTDDLLNEIEQTNDLEQFFDNNDDAMICSTISEELNALLTEKGIKKPTQSENLDLIPFMVIKFFRVYVSLSVTRL